MECIEQSASTSLLCPICHSSLPSPLSTLPINYSLHFWQTLSPLPPFSLPSHLNINKDNENNEKEKQQICDECEEHKEDVYYCSDCKTILCFSCSDIRRTMKNHSISPLTSTSFLKKSSTSILPLSSPIIYFNHCDIHKHEEMKLYCMTCNECVCVDCTGDSHAIHSTKSVLKRVEDIKEEWKKSVEEISIDFIDIQQKSINDHDLDQVNEEIKMLEEKLKSLIEKKEFMIDEMKKMNERKEKINLTTLFLLSFIQSLPPLPLSTFIPTSNHINNNNIIIIDEENKTEKNKGIKEFFEKETLISLFSTLISSTALPSLSSSSSSIIHINQQRKVYSAEEKERRNGLFFSNQRIYYPISAHLDQILPNL